MLDIGNKSCMRVWSRNSLSEHSCYRKIPYWKIIWVEIFLCKCEQYYYAACLKSFDSDTRSNPLQCCFGSFSASVNKSLVGKANIILCFAASLPRRWKTACSFSHSYSLHKFPAIFCLCPDTKENFSILQCFYSRCKSSICGLMRFRPNKLLSFLWFPWLLEIQWLFTVSLFVISSVLRRKWIVKSQQTLRNLPKVKGQSPLHGGVWNEFSVFFQP